MLRIKFARWRDYLLRGDLVNVQWIRIPANISVARQLYGLGPNTKWMLIYFLAEAGLQNEDGALDIEIDYAAHHSGCSIVQILDSARALEKRGYFSLTVEDDTLLQYEDAKRIEIDQIRAEETRTRAESARTRAEETRTRADPARTCTGFDQPASLVLNNDVNQNHSESLDYTDPAQTRADPARTRAEETRTRAESAPREEKRREEERREEKRREEERSGILPHPPSDKPKRSRAKAVQVMDLSDAELDLGTQWLKYAVTHFPNRATDPKWTPDQFALELRKVANVAGLTMADMHTILAHIKGDTFWARNATSPSGLLKKGANGMRKVENIFAQTKTKAQIKNDALAAKWEENPEEREAYERGMALFMEGLKK